MNREPDKERLLADVLGTEPDAEFSAGVLAQTLRGVRRQRRVRQVRRSGAVLVVLVAAALASSHFLRNNTKPELARLPQPTSYQPTSYQLVTTHPLTPDQLINTQALSPEQQAVSARVAVVQTSPGGFGEIGDDELLSLAAPNVVALVRRGPHEAELVFVSAPTEDSSTRQN
ncbi:MAG TPA: hypothetical protein VFZ59_01220 [Verrucomicrobiae bacterium]|nr:hypothetical protein [Verrucomicrobiae bacterium]